MSDETAHLAFRAIRDRAESGEVDPDDVLFLLDYIEGEVWPDLDPKQGTGAKLTDKQVVEIRERYEGGDVSQIELGEEYGVHPDTISLVVLGKTWSDADGPISKPTGGGEP